MIDLYIRLSMGERRLWATARLVLGAAATAGALRWLWDVPVPPAGQWPQLVAAAPDLVAVAALRLLGLASGGWLLASSLLYVCAAATRLPGAIRAVGWACPAGVRRLADRALAVTLASAVALPVLPALAYDAPGVAAVAGAEQDDEPAGRPPLPGFVPAPGATADDKPNRDADLPADGPRPETAPPLTPAETAGQGAEPSPLAPPPSSPSPSPPPPEPRPDAQARHRVVAGEHLWGIAAGRADATASAAEVAGYWTRVVAVNRARLVSGDPDLIYPGETVVLPPLVDDDGRGPSEEAGR